MPHNQELLSTKMEETKAWVLEQLLREREFVRMEIQLQCDATVRQGLREEDIWRRHRNYNQLNRETVISDSSLKDIVQKEIQKMRQEMIHHEKEKMKLEKSKIKMKEKTKQEEMRWLEEKCSLTLEKLKEVKDSLLQMEKALSRMEAERSTERKEMEEFKNVTERERKNEREWMRNQIKMIHRERIMDQDEIKEFKEKILMERQIEREAIKSYMETTEERLRLLENERRALKNEKTMKQEKKEKDLEKYIQEEECMNLELRREIWWFRTERSKDKKQIRVLQDKERAQIEEMEKLKTEMEENLTSQKELLDKDMKDLEQMRLHRCEEEKKQMRGLHLKDLKRIGRRLEQERKKMRKEAEREKYEVLHRRWLENLFLKELAKPDEVDVEMKVQSWEAVEGSLKNAGEVEYGPQGKEIERSAVDKGKKKWNVQAYFRKLFRK